MKRIEELGISPWPWKAGDYGCVRYNTKDDKFHYVVSCTSGNMKANSRLIAAAPELYECLREAVIEVCHSCTSCGASDDGYACHGERECFVKKWRDALANAGGEEVTND